MFLDAIDHVQLAMPPGGEELATWFYTEVLGVPRVPKPPELAIRGGCWFEQGAVRIHLGVQADFVPATKAHPAFAVSDLDRLARSIESSGVPVERVDGPEGPQVYVLDPFGNRLEFRPGRPVCELPEYVGTVSAVGAAAVDAQLGAQLDFIQELDRLKTVERQSFVAGGQRRENSAEHSWHVAVLAAVLADRAIGDIDLGRVLLMLLVHDIVEIDAGDTAIYDTDGAESKVAREIAAADRLFGLLPDDLRDRLREAWEEYERGDSVDAAFARACDRLSPLLLNLAASGLTWRRWNVTADRVRGVLQPIGAGAPDLATFVDAVLDRAVADRLLPAGGSGLVLDTRMPDLGN